MSILYVLHRFGPYKQYLRAYARESISQAAEQGMMSNDTEKRISDLKTDSLGGFTFNETISTPDLLFQRAVQVGSIMSYS